ncbi:DUF882 domain-containing protein [Desulforhabdus amnigena]|jgi:uncharacterized protein YcbK (DUF882 family)|uniref:Murein endopeptidase K n=1 Tax=Desulforhabdus amnigena TaxID=40218 RepID=A0A9W6D1A0_9BACT|nr:DUF882 domain-containing protein [Desulforhabdus amnigena]NLJ28428.1 DUF882 domain-containing protein [Deltaproteobacteria bacterium]GLI33448.1 membrane protein [Desulforhabdus amnigena]
MTRRQALKLLLLGTAAASTQQVFKREAEAAVSLKYLCTGKLDLHNIHTNESLSIQYLDRGGDFDPQALTKLNHLFRCSYDDSPFPIDPQLFLLLDAVRTKLGSRERHYHLVSGYRSPSYNEYLRQEGHGVAKNSYHIRGMAADVRLEGVDLIDIQKTALLLNVGGVGGYPDFVHLDVGPVRQW